MLCTQKSVTDVTTRVLFSTLGESMWHLPPGLDRFYEVMVYSGQED